MLPSSAMIASCGRSRSSIVLVLLLFAPLSCSDPPPPFSIPEPDLSAAQATGRERLTIARQEAEATWVAAEGAEDRAAAAGELAMLYHATGLRLSALAGYELAHSQDPDRFRWVYLRGLALVADARLAEAREAFSQAAELEGGYLPVWVRLGDAALEEGDLDAAQAAFSRADEIDPDHPAVAFGHGRIAVEDERWADAVEAFRRVLAREPRAGLARYRLAQALRATGDGATAEALLAEGTEGGVPLADRYEDEIRRLAHDEAVDVLLAMARDPGERTDEELVGFAVSQFGDVDAAVARLGRAADADDLAPAARARLLYVLGSLEMRRRESVQAAEHLRQALDLDPSLEAARRRLGELRDAGDRSAQEGRLRQALAEDPSDVGARRGLAALLGRDGRYDEAAAEFRRLIEVNPQDEGARMGEATALILAGRHGRAAESLEEGVAALPESGQLLTALARHLAASPDPSVRRGDRAVTLARRALAASPRLENAETLAMAQAEAGRFEAARVTQRDLVRQAEAGGVPGPVLERLRQNLKRYEAGQVCCG